MKNSKFYFATAIFWLLLVTFLLSLPGTKFPKITWLDKIWFDKWVHFGLFLVLVILWCRAFWENRKNPGILKKNFTNAAIIALIYGIMMEFVQHFFIPYRSFDIGDILADGLGCLVGYIIVIHWYIKK